MELREFAERVLFTASLREKLESPPLITDQRPGCAMAAPLRPGRPPDLQFKPQNRGKTSFPGLRALEQPRERGRLLHFFANHELLATELMALVLLRFPDAPPAFRQGVLRTLKEEQEHTRWYLDRMAQCGITFGELPVSGYFWRAVSSMESPLDYVAGLSLTFEQANLDFARFFSHGFAQVGDAESSSLLDRIYHDEIAHVAYGLKWFRRWKAPDQSDWEAFRNRLKFPLSAQRARGPVFNSEGRVAAGFDQEFIDELKVYSHSKGRTPGVFVFNPFAEGYIAQGSSFTPNKAQQQLQRDLENLPQFLCRQDDVVLVERRPAAAFLCSIKEAGYGLPEFVELLSGRIEPGSDLSSRKLGKLRPWAWGPDSYELMRPLFSQVSAEAGEPQDYYHDGIGRLYSKAWSAALLRKLLQRVGAQCLGGREAGADPAESWLCAEDEVGTVVRTLPEALARIAAIRLRGHHPIVVKETLGVAGLNAIRLLEPELLGTQRRWLERALDNGRGLIVEPWLDRQYDFSVQFEMESGGLRRVGFTTLINDWKGQYQGNSAVPGFSRRLGCDLACFFPQLSHAAQRVEALYSDVSSVLEEELRNAAYRGPVGIDAFIYRSGSSGCRLKPIVELNPRFTLGRLTLELMKQISPGSRATFRLLNRATLKQKGHADFSSWASQARARLPVQLEGAPVAKIREGLVCLNDPSRAQVCLAVLHASRGPTVKGEFLP